MSIATEIARIQAAKENIRQSIIDKGVDVPASAKIDTYFDYVEQIEGGGGTSTYATPFYIENTSSSTQSVWFKHISDLPNIVVQYSTDMLNWSNLLTMSDSISSAKSLPANTRWYLRANCNSWGIRTRGCTITGCDTVGGNIMSLIYGDNFTGSETSFKAGTTYVFSYLFNGNDKLKSAAGIILPATTLVEGCYQCMFQSCTSLLSAPVIPNVVMANYCCQAMFQGCTALICGAEILSTNLNTTAFQNIYNGCINLRYIKILTIGGSAARKLSFMYMTNNVQSGGVFVQHEDAVWAQNGSAIPSGWTISKAVL